jgi:hypothetical protein
MIEDKLNTAERIRLEALSQANQTLLNASGFGRTTPELNLSDKVLTTAERYVTFITTGKTGVGE